MALGSLLFTSATRNPSSSALYGPLNHYALVRDWHNHKTIGPDMAEVTKSEFAVSSRPQFYDSGKPQQQPWITYLVSS